MEKQATPRCHTLVMGCCASGKCTLEKGSCGCGDDCKCPPDANCRNDKIRVKPELQGSGNSMLYAGALIVLAAAAGAAYMVKKQ